MIATKVLVYKRRMNRRFKPARITLFDKQLRDEMTFTSSLYLHHFTLLLALTMTFVLTVICVLVISQKIEGKVPIFLIIILSLTPFKNTEQLRADFFLANLLTTTISTFEFEFIRKILYVQY